MEPGPNNTDQFCQQRKSKGVVVQAAELCLACTECSGDISHLRSTPKQDPQCNIQQPLAKTKENAGRPNPETSHHDLPLDYHMKIY